jgi:hypothetical protein
MDQRISSRWPVWNHATSTAAGPKMFESMGRWAPVLFEGDGTVARCRSTHHSHHHKARHLVPLLPSLAVSMVAMGVGSRKSASQ